MMMNLIAELSKGGKTPDGKPVGMPQPFDFFKGRNAGRKCYPVPKCKAI